MTKTCAICDKPIKGWYATHCRKCSQSLRRARELATQLTPDQKRTYAKAAVQSLLQHGRVKVRFLTRPDRSQRPVRSALPIDRQPPKEPPPPPHRRD